MSIDALLNRRGTPILIHREGNLIPCPCRTPEGYRDPKWHKDNPSYPECNDAGFIVSPVEVTIRAIIIPAIITRRQNTSQTSATISQLFGEVRTDDHIGVFPFIWNGVEQNFRDWSPAGEEWIDYRDMRFIVISWVLIPDPSDTSKIHHWECGLRRINRDVVGVDYK